MYSYMNKETKITKKKKLKTIIIVVVACFAVLGLLVYCLPMIVDNLGSDEDDYSYNNWLFFEVDYDKNILEDDWYLSHDRGIHYNRYGNNIVLTEENISTLPVST